jgi:hypothetical protein
MPHNPAFWSSIGFWTLMLGLVGDLIVIFVPSGRTEKILATIFTLLIALGVLVEHVADAKRFGPRTLDEAQQTRIISLLKPFAGQEYEVVPYWDLKESYGFASSLHEILTRAGWTYVKPETAVFLPGGVEGVQVYVRPEADERARGAAVALVAALTNEGIAAEPRQIINPEHPTDRVHLNVGTKP